MRIQYNILKIAVIFLCTGMVGNISAICQASELYEIDSVYDLEEEEKNFQEDFDFNNISDDKKENEDDSSNVSDNSEENDEEDFDSSNIFDNSDNNEEEELPNYEAKLIYNCQCRLSKTLYYYDGKEKTPAVVVNDIDESGNDITLTENVDYTIEYEQNIEGVGRVIIRGIGSYTGYQVLKFGIVPKRIKGLKVKSPFIMEATVTWDKVDHADGFYVYRKKQGGKYKYIANITDGNYQVFHDKSSDLKNGKKYIYRIVPYVADPFSDENVSGEEEYEQPSYKSFRYEDNSNFYKSSNTEYYESYNYSCIKGKCDSSFESNQYSSASGRVTKTETKKLYAIYTGDAQIDYMASMINKKVIKNRMSADARVEAVYNWMVKNCTFTKDVKDFSKLNKMKCYFRYDTSKNKKKCNAFEKKVQKKIYKGQALCIGTNWHDADRSIIALAYHMGSCSYLTPMFNVLCNAAGIEAYIVDGNYVNKDGSKAYHNWSFARIGSKYYWYDVPVACRHKEAKSAWYKKGTKYWKTCHEWNKNATKGYNNASFQK